MTFRLSLPDEPYSNEDRVALFAANLEDRLRGEPGMSSVAFALSLPPNLLVMSNNYTVEAESLDSAGVKGVAEWNVVSTDYFSAMGIGVPRGRPFTLDDRARSPRVAIVNDAFVRKHYPDGQALGRRLKSGDWDATAPWTTIVGIAADVPYGKGLWGGADPTVYLPYAQNLWMQSPYVIVKSDGDPSRLVPALRQAVKSIDPNLPLRDPATMNERLRTSMIEPRLRSLLFALIAGLALALAVTGIYGVMAYHVNQRRRETAIRRALGARASGVVGSMVAAGLRLVGTGIVLGTIGAVADVAQPRDPALSGRATRSRRAHHGSGTPRHGCADCVRGSGGPNGTHRSGVGTPRRVRTRGRSRQFPAVQELSPQSSLRTLRAFGNQNQLTLRALRALR